jgi:hypothetical protein
MASLLCALRAAALCRCVGLDWVAIAEGQKLFDEGAEGHALYLVLRGGCKAVSYGDRETADLLAAANVSHTSKPPLLTAGSGVGKDAKDSKDDKKNELLLGEFRENDLFGEISVFLNIPRTATVICNRPSTLLLEIRRVIQPTPLLLPLLLPSSPFLPTRLCVHFSAAGCTSTVCHVFCVARVHCIFEAAAKRRHIRDAHASAHRRNVQKVCAFGAVLLSHPQPHVP